MRQPRPRSWLLLVVALATTVPLATAVAGIAFVAILIRSFDGHEETEPSQKARALGETISEAMNVTALVTIAAMIVCACIVVVSIGRRRRQRH